jgi:hypothetical protein
MTSSMAERWVVNASPIILLGKAGVIHLLPSLCDELVVPTGVTGTVIGRAPGIRPKPSHDSFSLPRERISRE